MTRITVPIALGDRAYDVVIGAGLLAQAGAHVSALRPGVKVAVVADHTTARLFGDAVLDSLRRAGMTSALITVQPGEASKSFAGLEQVCDGLLAFNLERRDLVFALGGGVIGDLAGLAAGLVKRGVDFVQVPTTLLAQVDSSVGGKTAIDAKAGKNLIGLFHQPRLVLADLDVLAHLPKREVRAGLAEVIKYGLISDAAFFDWCCAQRLPLLHVQPDAMANAVAYSVRAKAKIVIEDERETGARALLNLGHTFGHAIELLAGMDSTVLHGEAVAMGMAMAFEFSAALGLCSAEDSARVTASLRAFDLPLSPPAAVVAAGVDAFLSAMAQDKKNENGRITLILARGIGQAFVMKDAPVERLSGFLKSTVFENV